MAYAMDFSRTPGALSAATFGGVSFLVLIINKEVLTVYRFPSSLFLGLGQMLFTVSLLWMGKALGFITFPNFDLTIPRKVLPLPLLYLGNHLFGLISTKRLSLPMFTALRKISIIFTLFAEIALLGLRKPSLPVQFSVVLMIVGAAIAASADLSYDGIGYLCVLLNNVFTAANGVCTKYKLNETDLGRFGVLYYNCLFVVAPCAALCIYTEDLDLALHFEGWRDTSFIFLFFTSCMSGFVLLTAIITCTQQNSALTTIIIGCFKNVLVTYVGMIIGGDYIFSWMNFIGLNVCIGGGVLYSLLSITTQAHEKTNIIAVACTTGDER
uniref:nucleotide sugar transporter SLC35D1-like isoform X2 n=1 Tax=Myxine glutinosa TaxID=7769 RepID=UPI00358E9E11